MTVTVCVLPDTISPMTVILILSSEVGVLDIDPTRIVLKERLHPGKMLLVDTVKGRVIDDDELKESYAKKQPYGEWLDRYLVNLSDLKIPNKRVEEYSDEERAKLQKAFGYTYEEYRTSILNMAKNGAEGIASMGIDTPLAVLSECHVPLFNYFKQLFAQVTNPPIDAIREEVVTSTTIYIGEDGNLLQEEAKNCQVLKINNPILTNTDMLKIKNLDVEGFKVAEIPITYYKNTSLEKAIDYLFVEVDRAHRDGANILILTDRGVDETVCRSFTAGSIRCASASCKDEKENFTCNRSGIRRTKRSTSFCYTAWLWCKCDQPISGTGYDPSADRQQDAG